jgi:hypothetical protein
MIPIICNGQRLFYWSLENYKELPVVGDDIEYGSLTYRVVRRVWAGADIRIYVSQI